MKKTENKFEWSKPYYGLTHLISIPKRYRITINEFNSKLSIIQMFDKEMIFRVFTAQKEFRGTDAECRKEGEMWAEKIEKGAL
jgi:hypothetical protein